MCVVRDDSRTTLTDREIVDVALAAGLRNHYSRVLNALAVEPDVPPSLPERLRSALVDDL